MSTIGPARFWGHFGTFSPLLGSSDWLNQNPIIPFTAQNGAGGNRTRVREPSARCVYVHNSYFVLSEDSKSTVSESRVHLISRYGSGHPVVNRPHPLSWICIVYKIAPSGFLINGLGFIYPSITGSRRSVDHLLSIVVGSYKRVDFLWSRSTNSRTQHLPLDSRRIQCSPKTRR